MDKSVDNLVDNLTGIVDKQKEYVDRWRCSLVIHISSLTLEVFSLALEVFRKCLGDLFAIFRGTGVYPSMNSLLSICF